MQYKTKTELGVTPETFKNVMANFATGITVVSTANAQGEPAGLLVNSLASVSLEPPLVLFCLAKKSQLHSVFAQSNNFAVNILCTDQEWIMKQFITPTDDRWAGITYTMRDAQSAPIIDGNLAHMECDIVARHDAGDHTVYVGKVIDVAQGEGDPLLYYKRQFGAFSDQI